MTFDIRVPAFAETITQVTLMEKSKKEGEFVRENELLGEVEADKVSFDVLSSHEGLVHWLIEEKDVISIGDIICTIRYTGASVPPPVTRVIDLTDGPIEIRLKK